jgi:hypothetical protein
MIARRLLSATTVIAAMIGSGCASNTCTGELAIDVVPHDTTIAVGQSFTGHGRTSTCGGQHELESSFRWSSWDTTVLRVEAVAGRAQGLAPGKTKLQGTDGVSGLHTEVPVTVMPATTP